MLTDEYIQSIVDQKNLVVRNLQVTQGYFRLTKGMKKCVSGKNLNWCAFAMHASKTAGMGLRHELMPRLLKSAMIRMAGYDNTFLYFNQGLIDRGDEIEIARNSRLGEILRKISLVISEGNIKVFRELAYPFAAFIRTFEKDWTYDENRLHAFLSENLRRGPVEEDGQDYLAEAFVAYYNARFETDPKKKAEHVLHGNLMIGFHEQTRLQPQIEQAMAAPLDYLSGSGPGIGGHDQAMSRRIILNAVTRMMMTITLPHKELKLSENVIAPTGLVNYPQDLITITNPRCLELVRRFEKAADTLSGSGARNWASLEERMAFILNLFRSYQQDKRMWGQPFLPDQVPVIESGHFPAGPL